MKALAVLVLCAGLAGCNAAGEPGGEQRWSHKGVPFSFAYPADYTKASIDEGNTRGAVVGAVGLSKVDVIAVRRQTGGPARARHEVLGQSVTSELHAVPGHSGWTLECQYTADRAAKLRRACARALATVRLARP